MERPSSDILTVGWSASAGGSLFAAIDEVSASDADYIISPNLLDSPGAAIFGLTAAVPAGTHTLRVRARATDDQGDLRISLLDGTNTSVGASAWQALTSSLALYTLTVTTSASATRVQIEVRSTAVDGGSLYLDGSLLYLDADELSLNGPSASLPVGALYLDTNLLYLDSNIVSLT